MFTKKWINGLIVLLFWELNPLLWFFFYDFIGIYIIKTICDNILYGGLLITHHMLLIILLIVLYIFIWYNKLVIINKLILKWISLIYILFHQNTVYNFKFILTSLNYLQTNRSYITFYTILLIWLCRFYAWCYLYDFAHRKRS